MQLLHEANNRGIPIFSVDSTNIASILPQLNLSAAVMNDIRNAVAAGKQVITPQQEFSFFDWTGVGYIVLDVNTGAGAYLISGGLAGGGTADLNDLLNNLGLLMTIFSFLAAIAGLAFLAIGGGAILLALSTVLAAIGVLLTVWYVYNEIGSVVSAFAGFLVAALAMVYIEAVVAALVWSIGLGTTILAAIAFLFVVTVIVALLIALLTAQRIPDVRRRMYAYLNQLKAFLRTGVQPPGDLSFAVMSA